MQVTDFRVISEAKSLHDDFSPERAQSQLSIDSHDRGHIRAVLADTISDACTTGFSCYTVTDEEHGEALFRIEGPKLNAFSLHNGQVIPVVSVKAILVEGALIREVRRQTFPGTDLALIDGAMGLRFDIAAGIRDTLVVFNNPETRRRCVALLSLLRVSPPRRRSNAHSTRTAAPAPTPTSPFREASDQHFPSNNTPVTTPKTRQVFLADGQRRVHKNQLSPAVTPPTAPTAALAAAPGQTPAGVRPSRFELTPRGDRATPLRTNLARSPLRNVNASQTSSGKMPKTYLIDEQWKQYRSLSPQQREVPKHARAPFDKDLRSVEAAPRHRAMTPTPYASRLCEMCMTPPARTADSAELSTSVEFIVQQPARRMSPRSQANLSTPRPIPPTKDKPVVSASSPQTLEKAQRPLSSSTQTTKAPDTIVRSSENLIGPEAQLTADQESPPEPEAPLSLQKELSASTQGTVLVQFYSPFRTREVIEKDQPAPIPSLRDQTALALGTPPVGRLLKGDPADCIDAMVDGRGASRSEQPSRGDAASAIDCSEHTTAPETLDGQREAPLQNTSTVTARHSCALDEPVKMPTVTSIGPMADQEKLDDTELAQSPIKAELKKQSFSRFFNQDFSETDPVDVLTTENTLTLLQGRQLSRHPHDGAVHAMPSSPTIKEEDNLPEDLPSVTDESFDVSASMITPSHIRRKLRKQMQKQSRLESHPEKSPLDATDESWRPVDSLSPLDKLKLSRLGVPTPFTVAKLKQSESSVAAGAGAFRKVTARNNASIEWR